MTFSKEELGSPVHFTARSRPPYINFALSCLYPGGVGFCCASVDAQQRCLKVCGADTCDEVRLCDNKHKGEMGWWMPGGARSARRSSRSTRGTEAARRVEEEGVGDGPNGLERKGESEHGLDVIRRPQDAES
jgi:hypothetical protein